MAAVTTASMTALDFPLSQPGDVEGSRAPLTDFPMASTSRLVKIETSPKRPSSSSSTSTRTKSQNSRRRAPRDTSPAAPDIPGRRTYNLNVDQSATLDTLRSNAPSFASEASTRSPAASSGWSEMRLNSAKSSAILASPRPAPTELSDRDNDFDRPEEAEELIDEPVQASLTPRPSKAKAREPARRPVTLTNLQMASLSTPELHLASDPLLDTEEPSFLRRLGRVSPCPPLPVDSASNDLRTGGGQPHTRTRSSDVAPTQGTGVSFSSFSAAMNAVENDARPSIPTMLGGGPSRSRPATASGNGHTATGARDGAGPPSLWQNENLSTETLGPSGDRDSSSAALGNANTWFQRQRRWSVNTRSPELRATSIADVDPSTLSSTISGTSIATAGTGTTSFSETDVSIGTTDTSLGADQAQSLSLSLESLRSARAYLVRELSKMTPSEMGDDSVRIANLAWYTREADAEARGVNMDSTREMFEFWKTISDGVLLCLLANRVLPGSVDRIDRRDVEWVKADNISRFLRAARDHLCLRSKDLFQTLDLTDATVEGLLRASHTILVIERTFCSLPSTQSPQPRTRNPAGARNRDYDHISPPSTPRSCAEPLHPSPDQNASSQRSHAIIQRNRREAERILVSMARPEPLSAEASVKARRRRSGESGSSVLPAHKMRGASITFADTVKAASTSNDDESRMPYRDRRLSESAISLAGVAEEEPEDEIPRTDNTPANQRPSTSPPLVGLVEARRGSSESEKSARVKSAAASSSPLARTSSQRRISAELGLGQLPRSVIGSTENLDDYMYPALSSPSRIPPTRRHSARINPNPSLLNPSRESLLMIVPGNDADAETSSAHVPRVPFPKSALQSSDSPGARRIGRHLSLNAGSSGADSFSVASSASASFAQPTPRYGPRPAYRHMRYSSDLHVPSAPRPASVGRSPDMSGEERSFAGSSRARFDSEVGSLYTNTLGSLTNDEGASVITKMSREPSVAPSSKHKLVVVEDDKPNVTYQLGNCIGRGQFGSVYRALNLNSGQMVAVKRIKLEGRSDEDVTQLMNEVDLLKSLTHPSVVKYEGLVRGPEVVSIILEYVENGSLLHTLKAFGNFPEKLVASYVVKILEGLNYLHEQNVVHCDLKAANILTTKNGNVKLSDFGVSLNLKAVEQMNQKNNDAIGTPNWMAPEVIELKGVTTAADIWSLACTIIELLTGKPPYYDMLAMSAMFRIVEDDCPPIPEKCSSPLRDLLTLCFNKDPSLRPSAEMLFEHEWVRQNWSGHKELRPQDSVPFLRRISADLRKLDPNTFNRDGKAPQPIMERSSSSPPPTATRPALDGKRSLTTPAAVGAVSQTPSGSPMADAIALPNVDGVTLIHEQFGDGRSPDMDHLSPNALSALQDPSLLDLTGLVDQDKPHAFVKSTFSKAVRCKICSEPVKKHAVLCEECGLVCHARCAGHAPSPCNLRAQLLMFQARTSTDRQRVVSPAPSIVTGAAAQPGSPALSSPASPPHSATTAFRFPFAMKRTSKLSTAELPSPSLRVSTEQVTVGSPSPPGTHAGAPLSAKSSRENGQQGSAPRRRRISLLPGRQTSPSPDTSMNPTSANSSNSGLHGHRRPSSISYGSVSGASSISSHGGAMMLKTTSDSSSSNHQHQHQQPQQQQRQQQLGYKLPGISSPQLPIHASHDSQAEPTRFRRRLSSGFGFGQSEVSLHGGRTATASMRKGADHPGQATGQITPTTATSEKRKSKRNPSKSDCIVM